MATIAEQLKALGVVDTLKHAAMPGTFTKLPWAITNEGVWSETEGWRGTTFGSGGTEPKSRSGAYQNAITYVGGNAAVGLNRLSGSVFNSERRLGVWLFTAAGANPSGYHLQWRTVNSGANIVKFVLRKWVAGVETVLAEVETEIAEGTTFYLVAFEGKLSIWKRVGEGEPVRVGEEVADSTFTEGRIAIDANGSNVLASNLVGGQLVTEAEEEEGGEWGEGVPIRLTWKGAYSAETTYKLQDAVSYLGSSYVALKTTKGHVPTEEAYWGKLAGQGSEGRWASLRYAYLTNTEETEPAAGKLKFNAGKTSLRISETDGDAGGISAYLAAWDDSTTTGTRGFIVLRKIGTPATFAIYKVTGALVDKGTWDTLPVELVASAGAFANEDPVSVEFYRTGDKGEKGEKGEKGTGEKGATGERGVGAGLIWEWEGSKTEGEVAEQKARLLESGGKKYLEVSRNALGIILAAGYIEQWKRLPVGSLFRVQQSQSRWAVYKTLAKATIVEEGTTKEHLKVEVEQVASNEKVEEKKEVSVTNEPILSGTDYGLVTALPASPAKGDRCFYQAAGLMAEKGIIWHLLYDGEGEFPWKKIGGPPLQQESNTERALNNAAYTSLPTDPLKITVPLKGDYDIEIQGDINNIGENKGGHLSYAVGATAASDNWSARHFIQAGQGLSSANKKTRQAGVAKEAAIEEKAKCDGAYEVKFNMRRLWVDPVRVG